MPFVIVAWHTVPGLKLLDQSLLATAMGSSVCQNIQQECFHLSMPFLQDLQHVLDIHVASQAWLKFRCGHSARVYFCVIFCGLRLCYVSHILMTSTCIQLFHVQHVHRSGSPHNVMHLSSNNCCKYLNTVFGSKFLPAIVPGTYRGATERKRSSELPNVRHHGLPDFYQNVFDLNWEVCELNHPGVA